MKKILSSFILVLAFVSLVNAQDQEITLGISHTYSVSAVTGYTYTWTVDPIGTDTDVSTIISNSVTIDWNQIPGTYNITVFATETGTSCISETESISVKVLDQSSVLFSAADAAQTCSDLKDNFAGGGDSGGNSSFEVKFTGGLAPYELKFKVLDPSDVLIDTEVTVSGLSATDIIDIPNQFINDGTVDAIYKVVIVSATTKDGASVDIAADATGNTRTITVLAKPRITGGISIN